MLRPGTFWHVKHEGCSVQHPDPFAKRAKEIITAAVVELINEAKKSRTAPHGPARPRGADAGGWNLGHYRAYSRRQISSDSSPAVHVHPLRLGKLCLADKHQYASGLGRDLPEHKGPKGLAQRINLRMSLLDGFDCPWHRDHLQLHSLRPLTGVRIGTKVTLASGYIAPRFVCQCHARAFFGRGSAIPLIPGGRQSPDAQAVRHCPAGVSGEHLDVLSVIMTPE